MQKENNAQSQAKQRTKYAKNVEGELVHILEDRVKSGKQGYFCTQCGAQKIANKGELLKYFRHDAKDVLYQKNCKFSDETTRHDKAKEILQIIKQIKVPAVYKRPPAGGRGGAYKIRGAETIYAHSVQNEVQFYEDSDGIIRHGKKIDFSEKTNRHLLIKADVCFFDVKGKPILLIELKATHAVDPHKMLKVARLGLDMVEVSVPDAVSPTGMTFEETIENIFYVTSNTKWIYNYEREETTYVYVPQGGSLSIPPINEFEAQILAAEQSYECRAYEVNSLFREVRKHLEGEQFRRTQSNLKSEIRRVEENAARVGEQLRGIQDAHDAAIEAALSQQEAEVSGAEADFRAEQLEFETKRSELDSRKEKIHERFLRAIESFSEEEERYRNSLQSRVGESRTAVEELEKRIQTTRQWAAESGRSGEGIAATYRRRMEQIKRNRERAEQIAESTRLRATTQQGNIADQTRKEEEAIQRIQRQTIELGAEFERKRARLYEANSEARRAIHRALDAGDFTGVSPNSAKLKALLEARAILSNIVAARGDYARLRRAKDALESNAYRDWV